MDAKFSANARDLLATKLKAIDNCKTLGVRVTLVTVVTPDINLHQVGPIIEFAKKNVPTVKGIHLQPLSYFGRYPIIPQDENRTVLPDLLKEIEMQTKGELRVDNSYPHHAPMCIVMSRPCPSSWRTGRCSPSPIEP
jgi:7,8-dihydro-6-hydroxymethylpterin dimethyltransferase